MIKISAKDGIVHLWDLPEDRVCVKLPNDLQKLMIEKALTLVNGRYKLAKEIGVKPVNIYDFEQNRFKSISLSVVKKLSNFLVKNGMPEFSLENLETKLELIKAKFVGNEIFHPKFPMNFNCEEGAQIIAGIFFDGGITLGGYPFYTNNEDSSVEKMIENVKAIVGDIEYNLRKLRPNTKQVEFPRIFGHILTFGLNIPKGKKVFINPSIPEFILNNPKLYKTFLRQAFDDEGSLNMGKSGKCVELNQYSSSNTEPPKRLVQLKEMIEKFNIITNGPYGPTKAYIAKDGIKTYGWCIQISNQSNIRLFAEKINFSLERKRRKLEELLNSYKLPPRFRKGTKFKEVIKAIQDLKQENKKITNKNIATKINRDKVYVAELTLKMTKERMLKIVKEKTARKGVGNGFSEKEFELMANAG